jgi:hypothetical protein
VKKLIHINSPRVIDLAPATRFLSPATPGTPQKTILQMQMVPSQTGDNGCNAIIGEELHKY